MKLRTREAVLLLTVISLLAGCASTGQTVAAAPPVTKLSAYDSVVVNVTSSVPETSRETVQLESMIISSLRDSNLFRNVTAASAGGKGDLRIDAVISDLRKVSGAKRALLGGFAGRGNMVVDVKLVDAKSNNAVGTFTAKGTTSGGTVFAGTTEQAIELAAREIVEYIQKNN